jgi:2-polyprenyl-3-methyl-5-hydroxy-6-metoxy-1,4-benzoquinol methylase
MDKETIAIYDQEAKSIAKFHASLTPHRIYELISLYFIKGTSTCDIGCGIGRDTHWLNQQGYPCIGVDASAMMLEQAQSLHPGWEYILDNLPELHQLADSCFQNILCSAVLMHLNQTDLGVACNRLFGLLNTGGCLIMSFRETNENNNREKGKLYHPIAINDFLEFFTKKSAKIILHEVEIDISRNLAWNNFVIEK